MNKCVVPGCKWNRDTTATEGPVQAFHFPTDKVRRDAWVKAIPRNNWMPSDGSVVCIKHFHPDDLTTYERCQNEDGEWCEYKRHKPRLSRNAIPKLFLENTNYLSVNRTLVKTNWLSKLIDNSGGGNERGEEHYFSVNRTLVKTNWLSKLIDNSGGGNERGEEQRKKEDRTHIQHGDCMVLPVQERPGNPPKEPKPSAAAGSSKRSVSDSGDGGKNQKERPQKKMKTTEDEETERDAPEGCLQDPFEMIEIEETRIKEEIFETEEFSEMKSEDILPVEGSTQENVSFETIYCTSGAIKEECQDDVKTSDIYNATETDTTVPEFMHTEIKAEPLEEDESTSVEPVSRHSPPPLMWRCPLVSCPEMFSAELEMYQHLNLNHLVKDMALSSKSKKVSGPRSVVPTVISPSTTPSVAISSASGLVFFTSTSSPRVSPVTVSKISVPVTTSLSVPSSSSGPVTVTTTFSYSSTTTSSAPLVTSVSGSSVSSVSSAKLMLSASSPCPPASSPLSVSTTTPDSSMPPKVNVTSSMSHSPNILQPTTASQGLQKLIVAPISNQAAGSTGPKQFLLLAPQQPQPASATKTSQSQPQQISTEITSKSQPQQISAPKTSQTQPLQIFYPSEPKTEDFPLCATDDSEMFSISLARFPQNKRVPIKQKLIDVVDCFKQKNISPEKLLIAYYEDRSDSRTV